FRPPWSSHMKRFAIPALAAFALVLSACPAPKPVPDAGPGGTNGDCTIDDDCPDKQYFTCGTSGKCEAYCRAAADCNARPDAYKLDYCQVGQGCVCDEGKCVG